MAGGMNARRDLNAMMNRMVIPDLFSLPPPLSASSFLSSQHSLAARARSELQFLSPAHRAEVHIIFFFFKN